MDHTRQELEAARDSLDALAEPEAAPSAGGPPPGRVGEPPAGGGNGDGGDDDPVPHNPEWEELVRKQRWDWLTALAEEHGLAPEEYEAQANTHLKGLLEGTAPWMRIEIEDLPGVLADGEFRNQFATGTSRGAFYPEGRRATEAALWGIPEAAGADERPKYGYLHSDPSGVSPDRVVR
jgi:hypothetical protein